MQVGLVEILLLVLALSLDSLAAGFSFGIEKIRVPLLVMLLINLVSTGMLLLSLLFGNILGAYIPKGISSLISFAILLLLGIFRLLDIIIKKLIKRRTRSEKNSSGICSTLLTIYADSSKADCNTSKSLSAGESIMLAAALSLDSLAAGLSFGMANAKLLVVLLASFAFGFFMLFSGSILGRAVSKRSELDLSWIGGVVLIALALMRL